MVEGLLEDSGQVGLELNEMVHKVGEEPIEDLESSINLEVLLRVDEGEQQVQEVLPDELLLLVDAPTHLNKEVADLADHVLILGLRDHLEQLGLHEGFAVGGETAPEVRVVLLVANVLRVRGVLGDVSAEDDCCE